MFLPLNAVPFVYQCLDLLAGQEQPTKSRVVLPHPLPSGLVTGGEENVPAHLHDLNVLAASSAVALLFTLADWDPLTALLAQPQALSVPFFFARITSISIPPPVGLPLPCVPSSIRWEMALLREAVNSTTITQLPEI
eukprot:TRINITY_DN6560_c0_g1_i1.p2 TRINITY_DN6560_c0_g1~~TRINITY_DN6560_c0_g1_i1.p2  ORF type:complete len:137 (-),score=31.70 TRINITY_DN6560_c0_g1_i1:28-438(-)